MDNENFPHPNKQAKSSRHAVMIVLPVLITAIIVGGVYAWQKSILNQTEQSLQTEISTLQKQVHVDWKTYTNNEMGYSIQYPSDWRVDQNDYGQVFISYPKFRAELFQGGGSVEISVENMPFKQWIKDKDPETPYDFDYSEGMGAPKSMMIFNSAQNERIDKTYIVQFDETDKKHLEIIKTFEFID